MPRASYDTTTKKLVVSYREIRCSVPTVRHASSRDIQPVLATEVVQHPQALVARCWCWQHLKMFRALAIAGAPCRPTEVFSHF